MWMLRNPGTRAPCRNAGPREKERAHQRRLIVVAVRATVGRAPLRRSSATWRDTISSRLHRATTSGMRGLPA